jgi:DNA-binding MarR family transcriptional regulator/N-acetylglutamate synthase-like GNAT family acetyltransferase
LWRSFNRFYTARLGLLRKRYLDSEFSLTESRVLFEISLQPSINATVLRTRLGLDAGYVSHLLSSLARRGLLSQTKSTLDARENLLKLSSAGAAIAARLNRKADEDIVCWLERLDDRDRETVIASLSCVHRILSSVDEDIQIVRAAAKDAPRLFGLLKEYFDEIGVTERDSVTEVKRMLKDERVGFWMAYVEGVPAGCVALRPLLSLPSASECKRLYVRPVFRGRGLAKTLLNVMERFAKELGVQWIYLDSKSDLKAAISLYKQRGYKTCKRYNKNPQATLFLRKHLADSTD